MKYYIIHAYVDGNLRKHLFGYYDMQEIKDEVQDLIAWLSNEDSGYKNITIEKSADTLIEEK